MIKMYIYLLEFIMKNTLYIYLNYSLIILLFHTILEINSLSQVFQKYAKCAPPYPPGPQALSMINI